jgi:hypothetical protein
VLCPWGGSIILPKKLEPTADHTIGEDAHAGFDSWQYCALGGGHSEMLLCSFHEMTGTDDQSAKPSHGKVSVSILKRDISFYIKTFYT